MYQGCIYVLCLISSQGNAISCDSVTIGCLCGSVAMWGRRVAVARHSAKLPSQPLPQFLTVWKAARFSGRFRPGGMSFAKWIALFSGQLSQSHSVMPQDKWAHSITFHCKGLFTGGTFAYFQGIAWLKHNNNNVWNHLWKYWMAIIEDTACVFLSSRNSWLTVMRNRLPTCFNVFVIVGLVLCASHEWLKLSHCFVVTVYSHRNINY